MQQLGGAAGESGAQLARRLTAASVMGTGQEGSGTRDVTRFARSCCSPSACSLLSLSAFRFAAVAAFCRLASFLALAVSCIQRELSRNSLACVKS